MKLQRNGNSSLPRAKGVLGPVKHVASVGGPVH